MLERSVAVIDAADSPTRALLASAHTDFREGRRRISRIVTPMRNRCFAARPRLLRDGAESHGSSARIFAIGALFEQAKHDAAEREMEALLDTVSLISQGIGHLCSGTSVRFILPGRTGERDQDSRKSASLMTARRDSERCRREAHLAFVYDQTGDPAKAWKYRLAALQGLGRQSSIDLRQGSGLDRRCRDAAQRMANGAVVPDDRASDREPASG